MDISKWNLEIRAVHVPTRADKLRDLALKWKITLLYKGREVLTTDYSAGIGHCPSYRPGDKSWEHADLIRAECATGRPHKAVGGHPMPVKARPIMPKPPDVLHCLLRDAEAIDYPDFTAWASALEEDPDSRKAEAIYRLSLDTGLRMRAALGDALLTEIREAFQDY